MVKQKFYGVKHGREGPKVYNTWAECERVVRGWSGACYKGFLTKEAAQSWLISDPVLSVEVPHSCNPWSSVTGTQWRPDHHPSPAPKTPPSVPLDVEPFTEDFISLPSSPVDGESLSSSNPPVSLSDEQQELLSLAQQGKNIFFTGSAGTGKSILLGEIIKHFGGRVSETLAITASTGIAAINIKGTTLHSWAGIGLGVENADKLLMKIMSNRDSRQRWRQTRTLIIDEISMLDGNLYDKLEYIARNVRYNEKPFGGIQLVLSGDFCQLPPVPDRHGQPLLFAFEANSWGKCFDDATGMGTIHRLTKVFRQKDQSFVDMLNSMRYGRLDAATSAKFYALSRSINYNDGLEPCELFPLREQVREANETRLQRLDGKTQSFIAMDIGGHDIYGNQIGMDRARRLLDRVMAPESIGLKIGAQVMLIKNLVQGSLVNGSIGKVIAFQSLQEALGLCTELAEVDNSRERKPWDRPSERVEDAAPERPGYIDQKWPVVLFLNGRTLLLTPAEFEVVNVHGDMEARRDQIPLILAWALSIHKSQGQTLDRVKVDLGRVFEKGQAYVALSRATSLEGLQVLNFHPSKVMAHPRVLEYYKRLDMKPTPETAKLIPQEYDQFDEFDDEEALASYYAVSLDDNRG